MTAEATTPNDEVITPVEVDDPNPDAFTRKLDTYNALNHELRALTRTMSARQLGRVIREYGQAPLAPYPDFKNKNEDRVFALLITINDLRYAIMGESMQAAAALKAQQDAQAQVNNPPTEAVVDNNDNKGDTNA